jgi:hypothetical protein
VNHEAATPHSPNDSVRTAVALEDLPRGRRPAPFREVEHDFPTLEELCSWLGNPQIKANRRESEPL